MAITNAQQYQQLVNKPANGKRPGYRGDAAYGPSSRSTQATSIGQAKGATGLGGGKSLGDGRDRDEKPAQQIIGGKSYDVTPETKEQRDLLFELANEQKTTQTEPQPSFFNQILGSFSNRRKQLYNLATGFLPGSKQSITTARKAYADYLEQLGLTPSKELLDTENLYDYFDTQAFEKNLKPADANMEAPMSYGDFIAEKFGMPGVKYSGDVGGLEMYVAERDPITGKPTKYGYKETRDGRNGEPVPPLTPYQKDVVEEVDPNSLQGLLANRIAYRFMANGGRAGYQQGGEIMPRLNQLGSGLSSAEQTLQEINQRLQSAESTLGEGGGNTAPIGSGPMQLAGGATQQPAGLNTKNQLGYASFEDMMKNRIQSDIPNFFTDLQGVQRTPDGGLYNASNFQSSLGGSMTSGTAGGPMQSPLATAIGLASGGRVGLMGGGMPYEGGIMDLESARQMYGLGKLVKKATGAISKIMKSPVGKAALLYGLGSYGLGKGLFGGIKGAGFLKGPAMKDFFFGGKDFALKNLTGKGVLAGIGGISALSGLMSQPEEDEEETYYRGPGLDIDAIRRDPYGTKGPAFGFYAKGGDVKEPVAKDTMPLLDMNGMEKDYRADGGFVPIGRMERADDVPARLSKNEFVFTADAVRNAGDGDIDKGAEVMYNVMKNLEAGGDISEESQGLNGARNMFQTSKRLEEVL
jgi:hypothetical protein